MRLCAEKVREVLSDKSRRINSLLSEEGINAVIEDPDSISSPWYGQLMRAPQIMAYIIQLDCWLESYDVRLP
jgi:asparagine synthase (glutamine-hydrolysing)